MKSIHQSINPVVHFTVIHGTHLNIYLSIGLLKKQKFLLNWTW